MVLTQKGFLRAMARADIVCYERLLAVARVNGSDYQFGRCIERLADARKRLKDAREYDCFCYVYVAGQKCINCTVDNR